jgi:hypothetical protein
MNTFAIDPGKSGGFAWYQDDMFFCASMPDNQDEIIQFIRHRCMYPMRPSVVIMEQVGGYMPGKFTPGSAMFSFGENYGLIKGALMTLGLQPKLVHPKKWQNALELGKKKDHDYSVVRQRGKNKGKSIIRSRWKEHLVEVAQSLFPQLDVTLQTSDALLILHYQLTKC